jgi:PAS domain S-box-containing protein
MIHALEKNYRETLDAMPNAIHVVGRDLRILLSNRFMRKWLVKIGTDPEIAGKPFLEAFPFLPPSIEQEYRKVFAIGRILQTEEETVLPGGALIFTETTKIPILENGVVEKVVTVLSDVTEAKRAERAIRESEEAVARLQKLDSIGKVAGGIAHDFNNYLTGILGNITLAMTECGEGSRQREFLSVAEKAIIQAKGLSRQLLSFAKGNVSNERKPVLIESVVRNAIDLALCGSRVKTQFRFASDLPRIEADESQLYQVFHNVSVNAVQAMPQGGRLLVVAEPVSLRSDDFSELPGGIYLRISFTDTGSGIPEDVLPHIFDPFYTTRSEGNGLGLSTCLSIIRSHRGTISVVSSPGAGTTFSIFLPATGDWGCSE